jgi:hypothetical protein
LRQQLITLNGARLSHDSYSKPSKRHGRIGFTFNGMEHLFCLILHFLQLSLFVQAHPQPNLGLKAELDQLFVRDQLVREALYGPIPNPVRDSLVAAHHLPASRVVSGLTAVLRQTDAANLQRVRAIIRRYGYPGKTLVGSPTNEAAFYVLQHAPSQAPHLPLIRRAAAQGELPFRLYAMMLDRHRMESQQVQEYGTQAQGYTTTDPATGRPAQQAFIWPIRDPAQVNARRRRAGFELTVEQNAQRLGIKYQVLTLTQVHRLPGYASH